MRIFIEQQIIEAVQKLLTGRVNEFLSDMKYLIPPVEFSDYRGGAVIVPMISLSTCERSEKERIIRMDAYSLTITFTIPETNDSELYCYAYASAVCKALGEDPTLGGVADRAVITGKKYSSPKKLHCGEEWGVFITLRVTVEETGK
jgi:hypothetical protein